ncbi:MAG: DUF4281 domain-containing protein [Parvularculaceae bacterium]|nr:DUF4281 domain-containing protein [Parvularculaceae bacterium]
MQAEVLFKIVNTSVLPAWLLLAVLPRWRYTQLAVFGTLIPLLSIVYAALIFQAFTASGSFEAPDFSSMEGIQSLLMNPTGLVAGWTHYLAFDLFVGAWIARDAGRSQVPIFLIWIPLFFTLMAGPFGLILYLVIRQIRRREILVEPHEG